MLNLEITPTPTREEPQPVGIHSVSDVLKKFPAFDAEQHDQGKGHVKDLECPDCHAVLFSRADCEYHSQTSACPDSAALAYVLIVDATQPGGYRVERRLLPFDVTHSRLKCRKCKQSYGTQEEMESHQASHDGEYVECVHCQKAFQTNEELESHYDWHDDMEFRHHRNRVRAKQPGLKLQSELGYRDQSNFAMPSFKRRPGLTTPAKPMPVIHEAVSITNGHLSRTFSSVPAQQTNGDNQSSGRHGEDEFVAISFVSAEDLERTHAPNGIFRDPKVEELRPVTAESKPSTALSVESPERPTSTDVASQRSTNSLDPKLEATLRPDSPAPSTKTSSIKKLFKKSAKGPVASPSEKVSSPTSASFPAPSINGSVQSGHKHQESTASNAAGADFYLLSAIFGRISDEASRGDLATVKKESDDFLAAPPSHYRAPKQHHVRIHALSSPEGVIVTDVRGITRVLQDHAKDELTSGIRNMPSSSWARAKVKILSIRADLSSEKNDLADALWCYEELLEFVKKFPAIFPGAIWHVAILSNLADISEQLKNHADAEHFYLQALDASYIRQGRYDAENVKLLTALAELCKSTGHFRGSAELFSRVIRRREELLGFEDKDTLIAMQELAAVHLKLRNLQAARLLYEQSLQGLESISSLDDESMLTVMNALCDIYVQLNLTEEAHALSLRALPAMRLVLGPDHALTRATLTHFFEFTNDFDFDEHVEALLQDYQDHHTDGGLWVLQSLARAYSLAGLQRDAAKLFKIVWEARSALQGPQEFATLDALQGRCLGLEFMDDIDRATANYTHLLQLSSRVPPGHEARKRITPTRSRLNSLRMRRSSLEEEKVAWGQQSLGFCTTCKQMTSSFCLSCQIYRFCSEQCRDKAAHIHQQACHPSVSLCESKGVSTAESVPSRVSQYAVETVQARDMKHRLRSKVYRVAGTFALSLDPRRFTTFRVKLSSPVDTCLMFEPTADIRYAIVDVTTEFPSHPVRSRMTPRASVSSMSTVSTVSLQSQNAMPFRWFTPREQGVLVVPSGREVYLLVAPGMALLQSLITKRQTARRNDSTHWTGMTVPTFEAIGYCQGLVVDKKDWERFGYLIEVES